MNFLHETAIFQSPNERLVAWPRPLVSMVAYELHTKEEMFKYLTFEYREAALTSAWNDPS
jgi:hypothetical protein